MTRAIPPGAGSFSARLSRLMSKPYERNDFGRATLAPDVRVRHGVEIIAVLANTMRARVAAEDSVGQRVTGVVGHVIVNELPCNVATGTPGAGQGAGVGVG